MSAARRGLGRVRVHVQGAVDRFRLQVQGAAGRVGVQVEGAVGKVKMQRAVRRCRGLWAGAKGRV